MSSYRYWTLGVVAALIKCIAEELGYHVLAEPWQRQRIPEGMRHFVVPLSVEPPYQASDEKPTVERAKMDVDEADLQQLVWGAAPHHYSLWIGAAEEAKILVWWTPNEESQHGQGI